MLTGMLLLFGRPAHALGDGACSVWLPPEMMGSVERSDLDEASGLVISAVNDGVLWSHNDSGDDAVIYGMKEDGTDLGSYSVRRAENQDWEDLAAGPCPDDPGCSCLYAGDIGNNDGSRPEGEIYRFLEPDLADSDRVGKAETLAFQYPSGRWDAEALAVDPATGAVFIITKNPDGPAGVYTFPEAPVLAHDADDPETLELVTTLDLDALGATDIAVTGASASPGGLRVALRTAKDLLVFSAPEGGTLADAWTETPAILPMPDSPDGEAVAFAPDGASLTVLGEGQHATLWETRCASLTPTTESLPEAPTACPVPGCGCAQGQGRDPILGSGLALAFALGRRRRLAQPSSLTPGRGRRA